MRLIQLTAHEAIELKATRERFSVWIDADRITSIRPNFHWQTWAGRTYATPDGAIVTLGNDENVLVSEGPADVAEIVSVAWKKIG